jgi:putative transposase
MAIDKDLLDQLLEGCNSPEEIVGKNGLLKELTKGIMERALEGELTSHLGYDKSSPSGNNSGNSRNGHSKKTVITDHGKLGISIPRDRNGSFEPQIIEKGQRRFTGFDEKILSMYALGMTTRDIQFHLKDIYQVDVSAELVSQVTEQILEEVGKWQKRPLLPLYAIVYLDALWVKVREDNKVINKAVYIALGVDIDGNRDVLGLWIDRSEGARFWLKVVSELQNRGVKDILIACVDGLKGFPEAIEAVYPQTDVQVCIVHMIRNSFKFVPYKNSREFTGDLKKIYKAVSEEAGEQALEEFTEKWKNKYPAAVKSWNNNWVNLSVMFRYPEDIRRLIYTTNPIESLNASLRKVTKNKRVFPNDNAVFKLLFMAIKNKKSRWDSQAYRWKGIRNQIEIIFEERIEKSFTQKF